MKLAVFSGTIEGRRLCEHLSAVGVAATACVATAYGGAVMAPLSGITVREGRMDKAALTEFLRSYDTVADATHPYATVVTENLRETCAVLGLRYIRLIRPGAEASDGVIRVASAREAAEYLAAAQGNALLTTGSKELCEFTGVRNFASRLFARVLPDADVVRAACALGFSGRQLICMQGPFTREMNAAMLRAVDARYLVTKDTGAAGGVTDKLAAAREVGAKVVMISRPHTETGLTLEELAELLTGTPIAKDPAAEKGKTEAVPRFPLFVSLEGRRCVVIGGGRVACRRVEVLRRYNAEITVIAPEIREKLDGVTYLERGYVQCDLHDAFLVVAATDSRTVNASVTREAAELGAHLSVADSPVECTFWFPASCVSETVSAGVVSRGGNHAHTTAAAQKIREVLG